MINQDIQRMIAIIDSFHEQVTKAGTVPMEGIDKIESILGIKFPEEYRTFLNRYGAITLGKLHVYGISYPTDQEPSIVWALNGLWKAFPEMPKNLIPIRDLSESGAVVCIQCQSPEQDNSDAPIVLWMFDSEPNKERIIYVCENFASYISKTLIDIKHTRTAFTVMEKHVEEFEREYLSVGKLPRNYVWRPYRFCSQDVVLGLTVVKHSVDNNCLDVDVCLTSDIPEFEEGSGAKITTSFLLSEAYKCGGSMEIRFTENVEGQHVPLSICELAEKYKVKLEHASEGRVTPNEARELYVAITEFGPKLRERMDILANSGNLSKERACFVVHHGLWTHSELDQLILGCDRVNKLLGGEAQPEQRLLYQNDILHARAAIMGGFLDRKLAKRDRNEGDVAIDLEDDVRPLEISFDPSYYAKLYTCPEKLPIPWIVSEESKPQNIITDKNLLIILRARDSEDLTINFLKDLTLASTFKSSLGLQSELTIIGCLVPRDFEDLQPDLQKKLITYASSQGIHILVCPETSIALDTEANRRFVSSRIIRE